MEMPTEATGFLSAKPPRLEDAGLEDTALSPEGIQEAFRLAAQKVRSAATGVLENMTMKDDHGGCTEAPIPAYTDWELIEDYYDNKPGSCVDTKTGGLIEEGRDRVVDRLGDTEDKLVVGEEAGPRLGESGCVKGHEEEEKRKNDETEEKKKKKKKEDDAPGLIEAAI